MNPGVYYDLPMSDYHKSDGLSCSGLKKLELSPAHYKHSKETMEFDTDIGVYSGVHMAVLEPKLFESRVIVVDGNRNSNAVKEQIKEAESRGQLVVKQTEMDTILRVRDAISKHSFASKLLTKGVAEASFYWNDPRTGVLLKCRPDYVRPDDGILVDLKGFYGLKQELIKSHIIKQRYHWQSALHLEGVSNVLKKDVKLLSYVFYEDEAPYGVRIVNIGDGMLEFAKQEYMKLIDVYAECMKAGVWPNYSEEMVDVDWEFVR